MSPLFKQQLLGQNEDHLAPLPEHSGIYMHQAVISPLTTLIELAQQAGCELRVAGGFRSFQRQLAIWNNKCSGMRPVLDSHGNILDIKQLSSQQKVMAILRWSALPGASRHHWGTDCDIYDAAAVDNSYQLQLHPDEYTGNGPFAPMMAWLTEYLAQPDALAFFRPYLQDHGGIAPELWHLSYQPIAQEYEQQQTLAIINDHINQLSGAQAIQEKLTLLENIDTIYSRFIRLPE